MKVYGNPDNQNSLDIECSYTSNGYACYMDIYISDDYVLNWMNFNRNKHTLYPNRISIHCDSRGSQSLSYNSLTQLYECSGKPLCSPWKYGDIVCQNDKDDIKSSLNGKERLSRVSLR